MTIAACYLSPEGVVLGADSTTTYFAAQTGGASVLPHHYNNSQKLFEIGENSTLGIVTWGLGGLAVSSYRRSIAQLADNLANATISSLDDVANEWATLFWNEYTSSALISQFKVLAAKAPFDPNATPPTAGSRTKEEEDQYRVGLQTLPVGFCIGGYVKSDRSPGAFELSFQPLGSKPTPVRLAFGGRFWGAPNMIVRFCSTATTSASYTTSSCPANGRDRNRSYS